MTKAPNVANNIPQWARRMQSILGISDADPAKNEKLWSIGTDNWTFSSGSELSEEDYLRLRVIWYHWRNINDFSFYMRDNSALEDDEGGFGYLGYVSKESDTLASQIYQELRPSIRAYLQDIHRNKDPTRPSQACGVFYFARYWQGLVMSRVKFYTHEEAKLPTKVWKRGASGASASPAQGNATSADSLAAMTSASTAATPRTPTKQASEPSFSQLETPTVPRTFPATGGAHNPPTSDETYVNTALLLILQALTLSMAELTEPGNPSENEPHLGEFDWLADRLPLKLYHHQPSGDPVELMEARVDGYLCRRSSTQDKNKPRFNNLPLAIVETKPCVRTSGGTPIRWQESAEVACWVSSLDDNYEHYGLLQPSTSGRKR
ncbi:hypothetical protein VTH06DRAFT_4640 [Thermothelomyces fergusii]